MDYLRHIPAAGVWGLWPSRFWARRETAVFLTVEECAQRYRCSVSRSTTRLAATATRTSSGKGSAGSSSHSPSSNSGMPAPSSKPSNYQTATRYAHARRGDRGLGVTVPVASSFRARACEARCMVEPNARSRPWRATDSVSVAPVKVPASRGLAYGLRTVTRYDALRARKLPARQDPCLEPFGHLEPAGARHPPHGQAIPSPSTA